MEPKGHLIPCNLYVHPIYAFFLYPETRARTHSEHRHAYFATQRACLPDTPGISRRFFLTFPTVAKYTRLVSAEPKLFSKP